MGDDLELQDFFKLGGAALAGGASYVGAQDAIGALSQAGKDLSTAYGNVTADVKQRGEFTPYTVTSGAGNVGLNAGSVDLTPSSVQTGLLGQAGTMTSGLATGLPNQSGLANQAFAGAGQALGANTGAFASGLGGMYAGMGEQQIANAQSPAELQRLQTAMTQQGLTASGQPSQGLLGLQGLTGQANFSGSGADVTGAYSGIMPSQFSGNAGALAQQALGQADLGAQAQNVQGAFAGVNAPNVRTGAGDFSQGLLAQAQQGLSGETPTAQSVYEQIRATQTPEEERQRIALENRLAAQGRLGVQTDMYGTTPEEFAMNKAQAEARNAASLQAMSMADQLASSQQARATQLGQLGLSGEQIQAQLDSEGFGQQMQLGQSRLSEAQTQEALQSSVQQRQAQLAQLGLSADQIQNQLASEGFGQQMQLGQANIQAQQAQSDLESASQARASQLAQLGMSAEQIASQLQTEGLGRQQSSAQLAAQLAQTGAGISAQQQQLGQGLLGLGLEAQQLGGQLGSQDIANAASMFGLGQQASMADEQEQAIRLANLNQTLQASGIPLEQQLATANLGLSARAQEQANQQAVMNLLANAGLSEAGLLKDLALGEAGVTQEMIKSFGNIGAGLAGLNLGN